MKPLKFYANVGPEGELIYEGTLLNKRLKKKLKGKDVVVTISEKEQLMNTVSRGYFFGVVLPHYVYALIETGNDLIFGNAEDELMVRKELMNRHLKNGERWYLKRNRIVSAPRVSEMIVTQVTVKTYVNKNTPIAKMKRYDNNKEIVWKSPYEGEIEMMISEGDIIQKEQAIAQVSAKVEMIGESSLSTATKKEAWDFIERVRRECSEYLGHVIPDPDPNYNKSARAELANMLKSRGMMTCQKCKSVVGKSEMRGDYCLNCLI